MVKPPDPDESFEPFRFELHLAHVDPSTSRMAPIWQPNAFFSEGIDASGGSTEPPAAAGPDAETVPAPVAAPAEAAPATGTDSGGGGAPPTPPSPPSGAAGAAGAQGSSTSGAAFEGKPADRAKAVVQQKLHEIAGSPAWPLELLLTDVSGARDLDAVTVGRSDQPEDDPYAGRDLGVERKVERLVPELGVLETVAYVQAFPARSDGSARIEVERATVPLQKLARQARTLQVEDAVRTLDLWRPQAWTKGDGWPLELDEKVLEEHHAAIEGPAVLIRLGRLGNGVKPKAEQLGITFLDASGILGQVGPPKAPIVALLVSTRNVPGLRFLGHDLECDAKADEEAKTVKVTITEHRYLAALGTSSTDAVAAIPYR